MADQAFTAGTFYGATMALTTAATVLSTSQPEMVKWTGISREAVETTHLASGGKTFIAGDIIDYGEIEVTDKYSTQLQHVTLMTLTPCDTLTLTFPKRAVTCSGAVATTAATAAFPVIYLGFAPDLANDKPMTSVKKFRVTGLPTFVAAVT